MKEEDKALFLEAMKGVKPLAKLNKVHFEAKRLKHRIKHPLDRELDSLEPISDPTEHHTHADQILKYGCEQLQDRQYKQFKNGKLPTEAAIDLHGKTVDEARDALQEFIHLARHHSCRCVRVVHGKGSGTQGGKLKNHVNHWLKQSQHILAFHSCTPKDGGAGALYVLLKSNRIA